jgi:hypothetical protein
MTAYTIPFSDTNKTPITINTGTINYTTSIGLVGKNAPGYGQVMAEDFLHILENFADDTSPSNPIEGQLWYDTSDTASKVLKVWDGATWYPAGGVHKQTTAPTNVKLGDIWVDLTAQQLKIYTGAAWVIIGPWYSGGLQTGSYPESINDANPTPVAHSVIKNYVDGEVISIISKDQFTPNPVIEGFDYIYPGVNVSSTVTGYEMTKPGMIIAWAGGSIPPVGWLLCNGDSVSRTLYSLLYGVIGVTFGNVDSAHFNVPNIANLATDVRYIIKA